MNCQPKKLDKRKSFGGTRELHGVVLEFIHDLNTIEDKEIFNDTSEIIKNALVKTYRSAYK